MWILSYYDFILESYFGVNFTPLYHNTHALLNIIKDDMLKIGIPARGPKGICVSRSKYFNNDNIYKQTDPKIILNREKLIEHGYHPHPIDEYILQKPQNLLQPNAEYIKQKPWANKDLIKRFKGNIHMGKSQFPHTVSGKRPIVHNIKSLPNNNKGLSVEYEERILKDIKNVGKYIYAFNFPNEPEYLKYKDVIDEYKIKYPNIKILLNFKEI